MKKPRQFRVSCFAAGVPLNAKCTRHFAPRSHAKAVEIFDREKRQILPGKYVRVVLHQGNLQHRSYAVHRNCQQWTRADDLTLTVTAFDSFQELIDAPGFFPSLNIAKPDCLELANLYDNAQILRKDGRRAHRYAA